jgi:hypothetical protein
LAKAGDQALMAEDAPAGVNGDADAKARLKKEKKRKKKAKAAALQAPASIESEAP